jgi:hypothetical protein
MKRVNGGRGTCRLSAMAAMAFASAMVTACGGTTTSSGTSAGSSLPRLTRSVQYQGVKFSVPAGFSFTQVDPAASSSGYMLERPGQQGGEHCAGGTGWQATSVFFTSATNIEGVSGALHPATIDHGLSVNEDAPSASGAGCQYVTQHVVIPSLGVGMAISGDGSSASPALALAREIVATATPTSSSTSG